MMVAIRPRSLLLEERMSTVSEKAKLARPTLATSDTPLRLPDPHARRARGLGETCQRCDRRTEGSARRRRADETRPTPRGRAPRLGTPHKSRYSRAAGRRRLHRPSYTRPTGPGVYPATELTLKQSRSDLRWHPHTGDCHQRRGRMRMCRLSSWRSRCRRGRRAVGPPRFRSARSRRRVVR
jgi:hypothetical protein